MGRNDSASCQEDIVLYEQRSVLQTSVAVLYEQRFVAAGRNEPAVKKEIWQRKGENGMAVKGLI